MLMWWYFNINCYVLIFSSYGHIIQSPSSIFILVLSYLLILCSLIYLMIVYSLIYLLIVCSLIYLLILQLDLFTDTLQLDLFTGTAAWFVYWLSAAWFISWSSAADLSWIMISFASYLKIHLFIFMYYVIMEWVIVT